MTETTVDDAVLHRILRPGERLLWSGEAAFMPFTRFDVIAVPVTLACFVVAAYTCATSLSAGPLALFFTGQLALFFAHCSFGRLILRVDRRRRTVYALTDLRAIEAVDGTSMSTRSARLTGALHVRATATGDYATVVFGTPNRFARWLRETGLVPAACDTVMFEGVADGQGVARMSELIIARTDQRQNTAA